MQLHCFTSIIVSVANSNFHIKYVLLLQHFYSRLSMRCSYVTRYVALRFTVFFESLYFRNLSRYSQLLYNLKCYCHYNNRLTLNPSCAGRPQSTPSTAVDLNTRQRNPSILCSKSISILQGFYGKSLRICASPLPARLLLLL